ncbi:MAG TPA: hypothetical protein DCW90_00815 [Lachnospiraceae bacterium]|nr:hypothetical protein [Lachnospiraceae bacterium]
MLYKDALERADNVIKDYPGVIAVICKSNTNIISLNNYCLFNSPIDRGFLHHVVENRTIICGTKSYDEIRKAFPLNEILLLTHHPERYDDHKLTIPLSKNTLMDQFIYKSYISSPYNPEREAGIEYIDKYVVLGGAQIFEELEPIITVAFTTVINYDPTIAVTSQEYKDTIAFCGNGRKYVNFETKFVMNIFDPSIKQFNGQEYIQSDVDNLTIYVKINDRSDLYINDYHTGNLQLSSPTDEMIKTSNVAYSTDINPKHVFLIFGPSCCGKDYIKNQLLELFQFTLNNCRFNIIPEHTNRPRRDGEPVNSYIFEDIHPMYFKNNPDWETNPSGNWEFPDDYSTEVISLFQIKVWNGETWSYWIDFNDLKGIDYPVIFSNIDSAEQIAAMLELKGIPLTSIMLDTPADVRFARAVSRARNTHEDFKEILRRFYHEENDRYVLQKRRSVFRKTIKIVNSNTSQSAIDVVKVILDSVHKL